MYYSIIGNVQRNVACGRGGKEVRGTATQPAGRDRLFNNFLIPVNPCARERGPEIKLTLDYASEIDVCRCFCGLVSHKREYHK